MGMKIKEMEIESACSVYMEELNKIVTKNCCLTSFEIVLVNAIVLIGLFLHKPIFQLAKEMFSTSFNCI
jgi:hypothetical protein